MEGLGLLLVWTLFCGQKELSNACQFAVDNIGHRLVVE